MFSLMYCRGVMLCIMFEAVSDYTVVLTQKDDAVHQALCSRNKQHSQLTAAVIGMIGTVREWAVRLWGSYHCPVLSTISLISLYRCYSAEVMEWSLHALMGTWDIQKVKPNTNELPYLTPYVHTTWATALLRLCCCFNIHRKCFRSVFFPQILIYKLNKLLQIL